MSAEVERGYWMITVGALGIIVMTALEGSQSVLAVFSGALTGLGIYNAVFRRWRRCLRDRGQT